MDNVNMLVSQGDQGLQGPPGPFEYVDPPEDLYIKGEQVSCTEFLLVFLLQFSCGHNVSSVLFLRVLLDRRVCVDLRGLRYVGSVRSEASMFSKVLDSQSLVDCCWFQGLRAGRGMKGEKGIVGFPGPRVSWSLAPLTPVDTY